MFSSSYLKEGPSVEHSTTQNRAVLGLDHHTQLMDAALQRDEETITTLMAEHASLARKFFNR
jgi:DNA-binding GntR family transcriptional regulator